MQFTVCISPIIHLVAPPPPNSPPPQEKLNTMLVRNFGGNRGVLYNESNEKCANGESIDRIRELEKCTEDAYKCLPLKFWIHYRMVHSARGAAVTMRWRFLELSLLILIAEYCQSSNKSFRRISVIINECSISWLRQRACSLYSKPKRRLELGRIVGRIRGSTKWSSLHFVRAVGLFEESFP